MNENLPPKTPAIKDWLHQASIQLVGAGIGSAKLDTEIILAHTLRKSRTFLHAHGDDLLTEREREIADARLELRQERTPVAYIVGHKEFYGRPFRVTPATLIPRPESETMIDLLIEAKAQTELLPGPVKRLVDVGTGSGCLGITAKLELPNLDVSLLDVSNHALTVARANAKQHKAEVDISRSDLLSNFPLSVDYILANLPYVDPDWQRSPETDYEPSLALFAKHGGLALIYRLIEEAIDRLRPAGLLFLEADPRQHSNIVDFAKQHGFSLRSQRGFIVVLART